MALNLILKTVYTVEISLFLIELYQETELLSFWFCTCKVHEMNTKADCIVNGLHDVL